MRDSTLGSLSCASEEFRGEDQNRGAIFSIIDDNGDEILFLAAHSRTSDPWQTVLDPNFPFMTSKRGYVIVAPFSSHRNKRSGRKCPEFDIFEVWIPSPHHRYRRKRTQKRSG